MKAEGEELLRVDRLGPAGGGCLGMIGAVLVMIGFLLPWASCTGVKASGLALTTAGLLGSSTPLGDVSKPALAFLGLIPCLAIGLLGIGLAMLPAAARERVRAGWFSLRALGGVMLGGLGLIGLGLVCAFFFGLQTQKNQADTLGFGVLVSLKGGFWVTAAGFLAALVGALVAAVTAFLKIPLRR